MSNTEKETLRIKELIILNDVSLTPFFNDDIELLKSNPKRYWNSFLVVDNSERSVFIKKMQNHYNLEQLKIIM